MTTTQVEPPLPDIPPGAASVPVNVDRTAPKRLALLETITELVDPIHSETVKGWLLGSLRAPI